MKKIQFKKVLSIFLAMLMLVSFSMPLISSATSTSSQINSQVVEYLTSLYGAEQAQMLVKNLKEMGIIDKNGNLKQYKVELDGKELTVSEVDSLLADPTTDFNRVCKVDSQEVKLQDLKTMIDIEKEISRIQNTYYSPKSKMTLEHDKTLESLIQQMNKSGLSMKTVDSEEKDNSAIKLGYKSLLARISIDKTNVNVDQGKKVTFTFILSKALPYPVSFDYKTVDGAAKSPKHYTAVSGSMIFEAGETTKSIEIQTNSVNANNGGDYTNDRWTGDRPFILQCNNVKNIFFAGDKNALNAQINIQGNYNYSSFFTAGTLEPLCETDWVIPYEPLVRKPHGVRTYVGMSDPRANFDFYFKFIHPEGDLREYIKEGLVDTFISSIYHPKVGSGASLDIRPINYDYCTVTHDRVNNTSELKYNIGKDADYLNSDEMSYYFNIDTFLSTKAYVEGYFTDESPIAVQSVTAPAGNYKLGDVVPITVTFNEPVKSTTDAGITLGLKGKADLHSIASKDTYSYSHTFLYTVTDNDTPNLIISKISDVKGLADDIYYEHQYSDNTERRLSGVILSGDNKIKTFTSVQMDSQSYEPATENANVTINIDSKFSMWLENAPESVKGSTDGGKTFFDLVLSNDGSKLTGSLALPLVLDGEDKEMRFELYVNENNTNSESDLYCLLNKNADFIVKSVVFAEAKDISIVYPIVWPSGKENNVYLTANQTTELKYTYAGNATYKDFIWSSDNESIAKIDEKTGKILPQSPGKTTFRLTATNGNKDATKNVFVTSIEITINAGGDPMLVIPQDINTILISKGNLAPVRWSTNIIYKNQTDFYPPKNTVFTVKLYDGNLTEEQINTSVPKKTYSNIINVTDFNIPSEDVQDISIKNVPSYTVKVEVKHPLNETVLHSIAYIIVNSQPSVVKFDKIANNYLLDSMSNLNIEWMLKNFDALNDAEFEFSCTRNSTEVQGSKIVYENGKFTSGMTPTGNSSYDGIYTLPIEKVSSGTLKDTYTVNIKAKNHAESTWSYDSFVFYIYNASALKLMIDDKASQTKILMSNIQNISGMSSSDILNLNRNINLKNAIQINYGDYAWEQVTDKIIWLSEDSSIASVNFSQGGMYNNIENYSYTTYRPSDEFILAGNKNGTTTISATHFKTGMTAAVDVEVQTLKEKLYVFQMSPKAETEVVYTNGNDEEKTVKTDINGAIAIYEENGIKSDVKLKSTYNNEIYLGTIPKQTIDSGETGFSEMGLYPVNNFKLNLPAKVVYYLKNPNGTPYTGALTYRGGVYRNDNYCKSAEITGDGKTVTLGSDGKLVIDLDTTTFWSEGNDEPYKPLTANDKLDFVFEVLFDKNSYKPQILKQSSILSAVDRIRMADGIVNLENADATPDVFISNQVISDDYDGAYEINIKNYNKKIGLNADSKNKKIKTTVLWWGKENENLNNATVSLADEFSVIPSGQTYKTYRYPFGTITVTEHIQKLNESTLWMPKQYSRGIKFNLKTNETTLYKSITAPFRVINMLEAPKVAGEDSGTATIITSLKNLMTVDGGSMDMGDAFIGVGMSALGAMSMDTPVFTMQIAATQDPTVYDVLIKAGYSNMESVKTSGIYMNNNLKGNSNTKPGFMDTISMLKGEYPSQQYDMLTENASKIKNKSRDFYYELKGYYEGQVTYNYEKNNWESIVHSGGFNIGGGMGYQWTYNAFMGPIPVTAQLGLGAAIAVDFSVKALYEERSYNGDVQEWKDDITSDYVTDYLSTLRTYAYINAFGGVGFDYSVIALKIGVFGQIALDNKNSWLSRDYLESAGDRTLSGQSLTLTGRVGIRFYAKFLFFSYEKILASSSYTYEWVWNNWAKIQDYWSQKTRMRITESNMQKAIQMYIDDHPIVQEISNKAKLENRDYLEKFTREWNNVSRLSRSLDVQNGAPNSLQTNAYPYSNPELSNDGEILAYVSDAQSTDVYDTVASYALKQNGSYVDLGKISTKEKGFGDSALQIDGTKNMSAAVWVQQKNKLEKDAGDEITAAEQVLIANGSEIMISVYKDGKWISERLTENSSPDMSPVVAVHGNDIFVAWRSVYIENQDNLTDFGSYDQILYKTFTNGKWNETKSLYNGTSGGVMALQAAMTNDTAAVTYTLDKNGNKNSSDYEIVYSVVDMKDSTVVKNQQITTDTNLDENPQITTALLNDNEYFILGWHNVTTTVNEGETKSVSDIRLSAIDEKGNFVSDDIRLADSLSIATNNKNISVDGNFKFVSSENNNLNDLSLMWATSIENGNEANTNVEATGVLKSVKFLSDAKQIYTSSVIDVAEMASGTLIDYFDAYNAGDKTVKAVILGSSYSGEQENVGTNYNTITNKTEDIYLPTSVSGMYTATSVYQDKIELLSLNAELGKIVKGLNLPVQFTLENQGISSIDNIKVVLDNKTTEFDSTQINLLPNQSVVLPVEYTVPMDKVVNPEYTITATFTNGSVKSVSGTLHLAIPDVGISNLSIIKEEKGVRDINFSLYNNTETKLSDLNQVVKIGFFEDSTCQTQVIEPITINSKEDLTLIDSGAYTKEVSFNIKDYIKTKNNIEIPESGIPVFVCAWIEQDNQKVLEYNTANNQIFQQFYSLQKDNGSEQFDSQVNITNLEVTTANITIKNLMMKESSNINAMVSLLDKNNNIIETKYLAGTADELLKFSSEEEISAEVSFEKLGNSVQVKVFQAEENDMIGTLTDLSLSGMSISFDEKTMSYSLKAENQNSTNISAIAKSSTSEVGIYTSNGVEIAKGIGSVTKSIPLIITSIDAVPQSGKENKVIVKVQPVGSGATAETYSIDIQNNRTISGNIVVVPPNDNQNGWINKTNETRTVRISAENNTNFKATKIKYSFDGNEWIEIEGESVDVPLDNDGEYTIYAKALNEADEIITANPTTVKVDRTSPTLDKELIITETDIALEKDNIINKFLRIFSPATNKQAKITAKVVDTTSKLDSVIATTTKGDSYVLTSNGDGSYSGMITKSYEGVITITARDFAGNSSIAYSDNVLIDDELEPPVMQMNIAEFADESAVVAGSVLYEKDEYFKRVKLMVKKANSNDWKTVESITDVEQAKNISLNIDKLEPATKYDYQLVADNIVGDTGVVLSKAFTTRAKTPNKPEMQSRTSHKITLKSVNGANYRRLIDADANTWTEWSSSPVFENLVENMEYTFEMRIAATETVPESNPSNAVFSTYPLYIMLFNKNTDDSVSDLPELQNIAYDEKALVPEKTPYRESYTFTGWYTDKNLENLYDFESNVNAATTLYAGWSENKITDNDYLLDKDIVNWQKEDITITPQNDFIEISTDKINWSDKLILSVEGKNSEVTFYLKKADGSITTSKTLMYKLDKTAPTGEISIGENKWNSFLNTITFGLFFKDTQEVKVTSSDGESGVAKTEYYLANEKAPDISTVTDWKTFENFFNIDPNNNYVVYVKITDKVGNSTVINSDGIVLDNIVPTISGITDGKTYCRAQTITITDDNLNTVTVNGATAELKDGKLTVSPASEKQTIIASDKSGNSTTISITVNDGHTWDNGKVTTEPTTEKTGVKTYTCTVCDETKIEVIPKLPIIVNGNDGKWTKGSSDGLVFSSDADIKDFIDVSVDGKKVDKENYTLESGSTIVTLNNSYLETLSIGEHKLEIASTNGTAQSTFTVLEKVVEPTKPETPPTTGDTTPIIPYALLAFSSLVIIAVIAKKRRFKIVKK